ncbi:MAG: hypothetical protein HS115_18720 [Spirochaetales bacterium]|nr:hypothetical protein [Spirochaetales bacterium]
MRLLWILYTAGLLGARLLWPDLWLFSEIPPIIFVLLLLLSLLPLFWTADSITILEQKTFRLNAGFIMLGALFTGWVLWTLRLQLFLPPPDGAGDSLHLLEHIPVYTELFGFLDSFDEPLELYLRSRLYLVFDSMGQSVDTSYALISTLAGVLYAAAVLQSLQGQNLRTALLAFAIFLCTPIMALFAGYVESYTLVTISLMAVLVFAANIATNGLSSRSLLLLGAAAALSFLLHGIAAFALPALSFLVLSGPASHRERLKRVSLSCLAAGSILLPAYLYFFLVVEYPITISESFALRPPLLSPQQWFEPSIAAGKLQTLVGASPLLLPSLPLIFQATLNWKTTTRPIQILIIAWATFLLHFWVWNPIIGFPADRDLFSLFTISANLLLWYLYKNRYITPYLPLFAGLQLTFALAWILPNARAAPGEDRRNQAIHRADRYIRTVQNDPFFLQLPAQVRRTWVKAQLFADRMHEEVPHCRHLPALDEQMEELGKALATEKRPEISRVWQELTRINRAIQADCVGAAELRDARPAMRHRSPPTEK